ncbi:hypothetical protein AB0P28_07530 [Pseudarthrobacter sp. NPDC089323]
MSERALSLALHLAAGIVLAVVGLELMPEALAADAPWVPILAFVGRGLFFVGIERAIGFIQGRAESSEKTAGPLAIFSGVSLDLFSDGIMIGTATVLIPRWVSCWHWARSRPMCRKGLRRLPRSAGPVSAGAPVS